jgi:hypothetical protein
MGEPDLLADQLRALQALLRAPGPEGTPEFAGGIPADLREEGSVSMFLTPIESQEVAHAQESIETDLRFEQLAARYGEPFREAIWRLVCLCVLRPDDDHVAPFLAEHAKEVEERTCYFPVNALTVEAALRFQGIRLLPLDDSELPPAQAFFKLDPPVGCVIAVPVVGTNLALMKERARRQAVHALRVMRIALRENRFINEQQLRFGLTETYSFGDRLMGFEMPPDTAVNLKLEGDLLGLLETEPVARLPSRPQTKIGRRVDRAVRWLEQAALATDRVNAMLFAFFALESILGRRDQKLKAGGLAFRRAMLSVAISDSFADPDRAYRLYDEVRSDAVHGGDPEISEEEIRSFVWDIRIAVKEYLELAEREGLGSRGRLLRYLDRHHRRAELERWLRDNGDPEWIRYFEEEAEAAERAG